MKNFTLFTLFTHFSHFTYFTEIASPLNTLFFSREKLHSLLSLLSLHLVHILHRDSQSFKYSSREYLKNPWNGELREVGNYVNSVKYVNYLLVGLHTAPPRLECRGRHYDPMGRGPTQVYVFAEVRTYAI